MVLSPIFIISVPPDTEERGEERERVSERVRGERGRDRVKEGGSERKKRER